MLQPEKAEKESSQQHTARPCMSLVLVDKDKLSREEMWKNISERKLIYNSLFFCNKLVRDDKPALSLAHAHARSLVRSRESRRCARALTLVGKKGDRLQTAFRALIRNGGRLLGCARD
ncbi:hypothetical protein T4D_246 [Trichinella pseudospiralis]|uniref:Uncharacterized protein n=1 Tax=Trichinella pseudospiralis TaxID=6337 RepID=A0A0V1FXS1_TRIPS|nr:hypothetical protein T4D_246 [Trichinella pseudospiralis]